jgi:ribosomal protein S12 methylthiotransferase accessory factor
MTAAARFAGAAPFPGLSFETRGFASPYLDRARPAEATVAAMRPRFSEFGITRLACVTGLDHIGIPVWSAIRPNSRTLAVAQGKGLTDAAAQASAVMEAVEVAVAERRDLPHRRAAARALAAEGLAADPLPGLLRQGAEAPGRDEAIAWFEGFDLLRGAPAFVPLEAVELGSARAPARWWQSTDGLASGNILWEAVLHGLCERIERDALALWALRGDAEVAARCRDPAALGDAALDALIARIARAGMQLRLFDAASDIGVPVYLAVLSPPPGGQESNWRHFDLSAGSGCHPDPARAAIRAVTEAAQTRLTTISAIRDDFDPATYATRIDASLLPYVRVAPAPATLAPAPAQVDRAAYVDWLVARLAAAGVRSVVVAALEAADPDYAVAKVIVPDLENPPGERRFRWGRRALRAMTAPR